MPASDHSTLATVISAASALAAVAAAGAAIWSAKLARDAAGQASRQAREAILRDLSQSVTTVVSRSDRIMGLVTRLKVARQTACGRIAEQMSAEAQALEMSSLDKCGDTELQSYARNMGSYAARLGAMETELASELEHVEAENRDARLRNHRAWP